MAMLTRNSLGALAACEQIGRLAWRLRPDSREGGQRTTQVRTVGRRQSLSGVSNHLDRDRRAQTRAPGAGAECGWRTRSEDHCQHRCWLDRAAAVGQHVARAPWAVEGSGSLGRGVAQFLAVGGERVHEVNPRWTAQRRRGLRRPGKSDVLDAQAVARLLREEGESLPLVQAETVASASLQLWSRLRDDLVLDMTRLRNRQHALLLLCDPE